METVSSALTVKNENGFKEKLRGWYLDKIANNGNNFEKIHDVKVKAENSAGSIAVGIFAPYLLPLVPAVQKGYKSLKDAEYKAFRKFMHKKLNIKEEEIEEKPTAEILNELDDEKVENLVNTAGDIIIERTGARTK